MNIKPLFDYALVAAASYGKFHQASSSGRQGYLETLQDLKVFDVLPKRWVDEFVERYDIQLSTKTENRVLGSGLATVTLFDSHSGNTYVGIRGSEATINDWLGANYLDRFTVGTSISQAMDLYNHLRRAQGGAGDEVTLYDYSTVIHRTNNLTSRDLNPVSTSTETLSTDGSLKHVGSFHLIGHSLGGHIALFASRFSEFPIDNVIAFDAPGFSRDVTDAVEHLRAAGLAMDEGFPVGSIQLLDGDKDLISLIGTRPGQSQPIFTDYSGLMGGHVLMNQIPTLALGSMLEKLDPSLDLDRLNRILDAATAADFGATGRTVAGLAEIFGLNATESSLRPLRTLFYEQLLNLESTPIFQTFEQRLGLVDLSSLSREALAATAASDAAFLHALERLNPFALTGDPSLYAVPDWEAFSSQYLADRAWLLSDVIQTNLGDHVFHGGRDPGPYADGPMRFVDADSGYDVTHLSAAIAPVVAFGSAVQGDFLTGGPQADRLYGRGGADVLQARHGQADYLEGGEGNDTYDVGGGDELRDHDDSGRVVFNGRLLVGGRGEGGVFASEDQRFSFVRNGADLQVTDTASGENITIRDFTNGALGITLTEALPDPDPIVRVFAGDFEWLDTDASTPGVQVAYDVFGNPLADPTRPGVVHDELNGSEASDHLIGGQGHDTLRGLAGDDVIEGGEGDDYLIGFAGRDTALGGPGDDEVYGESVHDSEHHDDHLEGGDGNDRLGGMGGDDRLLGDAGEDFLFGDDAELAGELHGKDHLEGGEGDDRLIGQGDDDQLFGGAGQDSLQGDSDLLKGAWHGDDHLNGGHGDDILMGMGGADALFGGEGDDRLDGDGVNTEAQFHASDYLDGGEGNDTLWGSGADDMLLGGSGDDHLEGDTAHLAAEFHGDDVLAGGSGADLLLGGGGADTLYGQEDNDALYGDATDVEAESHGNDRLEGGLGDDVLYGEGAHDHLLGGDGDDELFGDAANIAAEHHGDDRLEGGVGDDVLVGGGGYDSLSGDSGNDQLDGDGGDVAPTYHGDDSLAGGSGADELIGSGGSDVLHGGTDDDRLFGDATDVDGQFHGDDWLDGGEGQDILIGSGGLDTLQGGDGDDELHGDDSTIAMEFHAPDILSGGSGNDLLVGGGDDDSLSGGDGWDSLYGDGSYVAASAHGRDELAGGEGNDELVGGGDADILDGGEGDDLLSGDAANLDSTFHGDDLLNGDLGQDILFGGGGNDRLSGGAGDDELYGDGNQLSGDDLLDGGEGDDLLNGGAAHDVLWGGPGDDRLYGDAGDNPLHQQGDDSLHGGDGTDILVGMAGDDFLDGGAGDDGLAGGMGDDHLLGGEGVDELHGEAGADTLEGGPGRDVYVFNYGDGQDTIHDSAGNTLRFGTGVYSNMLRLDLGSLIIRIGDGQDQIHINGFDQHDPYAFRTIDRFEFTETGDVWSVDDLLDHAAFNQRGTQGDDVITGTPLDDHLQGFDGHDTLEGLAGSDLLDGGLGADVMRGGRGDDEFHVDHPLDEVSENPDEGRDTVIAAVDYKIPAHVEELELTGKAITAEGDSRNNRLIGNEHGNVFIGGPGDDQLIGLDGNDVFHGQDGRDLMDGSGGDDIYYVDHPEDDVREGPNPVNFQPHYLPDGSIRYRTETADLGYDKVYASTDFSIGIGVEELHLTGDLPINGIGSIEPNLIVGNDNDNVLRAEAVDGTVDQLPDRDVVFNYVPFSGFPERLLERASYRFYYGWQNGADYPWEVRLKPGTGDRLEGRGGNDELYGGLDEDHLLGGNGDDLLYGFGGRDTLEGGPGNDRYVVNSGYRAAVGHFNRVYYQDTSEDLLIEHANEGRDTVFANSDFVLPEFIEDLTLLEDTSVFDQDSQIYTSDIQYDHRALVGTGNELPNIITGNGFDNQLMGMAGNDTLRGAAGDDHLEGGDGADTLEGGLGNDAYTVESPLDVVLEEPSQGFDSVRSDFSFTLPQHVEALHLTGEASVDGTGNGLANVLIGNAGANQLTGLAGDDFLDGKEGQDVLAGGEGNDTYSVTSLLDQVIEDNDSGVDTVESLISLGLMENVENLTLLGNEPLAGNGNRLDNRITGNAAANQLAGQEGDDHLDGGAGDDHLAGGPGDDVYYLDAVGDVVVELAGEGADRVHSSVSHTLTDHTENLTLTGETAVDGVGNNLANHLVGNDAENLLSGLEGDDIIEAASGSDHLLGGSGDDQLDGGHGHDRLEGGDGDDTLYGGDDECILVEPEPGTEEYSLWLELGWLPGSCPVENDDLLLGGAGEDHLRGGSGDDELLGGADTDELYGGEGVDILDGGSGIDSLTGGAGDDIFHVDGVFVPDTPTDGDHDDSDDDDSDDSDDDGHDSNDHPAHGDGRRKGNEGVGNGEDPPPPGHEYNENDYSGTSPGNPGNKGGKKKHRLSVAAPVASQSFDAVRMTGYTLAGKKFGERNKRATQSSDSEADESTLETAPGHWLVDQVFENSGEGHDVVHARVPFALPGNVEELYLSGPDATDGVGNAMDNVLHGNEFANFLDGGVGADRLIGGDGDDIYHVDHANDSVEEQEAGGTDLIVSAIDVTLPTHVEHLRLSGSASLDAQGNALPNHLIGNGSDNVLRGLAGADRLEGGAGADTLEGGPGDDVYVLGLDDGFDTIFDTLGSNRLELEDVEDFGQIWVRMNDQDHSQSLRFFTAEGDAVWNTGVRLESHSGALPIQTVALEHGETTDLNRLIAAANTVQGTKHHDRLEGGRADDVVFAAGGHDTVSGGWGNDRIFGGSGKDTLRGDGAFDALFGEEGKDDLRGGGGNDLLDAGAGADRLFGGSGADFLVGGVGNDELHPGDTDVIAFNRGDGQDSLDSRSSGAWTISLGGGIALDDLYLDRAGDDLILGVQGLSGRDQGQGVRFEDWYETPGQADVTLQIVSSSASLLPGDALRDQRFEWFDFNSSVNAYDRRPSPRHQAADPWQAMHTALDAHLGGSDTEALGGELAAAYGLEGAGVLQQLNHLASVDQPHFGQRALVLNTSTSSL